MSYFLEFSFILAFILSISIIVFFFFKDFYGNWDGMRIINTATKFIFWGKENWLDLFKLNTPLSRSDYPLMIPMIVGKAWTYAKNISPLEPAVISALYTYGSVFLLVTSICKFKNYNCGILAGIFLLFTAPFIVNGAAEYSDIPLSFYILAAFIMIVFFNKNKDEKYLIFAGLSSGLACWTKNEGLFFSFLLIISLLISTFFNKIPYKKLLKFLYGYLPVLAIIILYKILLCPPNDLLQGQTTGILLTKITDINRYILVIKALWANIHELCLDYKTFFVFILFLMISGIKVNDNNKFEVIIILLTIILLFLSDITMYLITPHEIMWQVSNSIYRLITHIIPSLYLIGFIITKECL
ncbi:MAG: glycosyltransferase family 39 protein [Candidatus Gastranaerophilaceae bacterium]